MVLPLTEAVAAPDVTQVTGVLVPGRTHAAPTQACGNSTALTGGVLNKAALTPIINALRSRVGKCNAMRICSPSEVWPQLREFMLLTSLSANQIENASRHEACWLHHATRAPRTDCRSGVATGSG